jgi:hypothetical protein
VKGDPAEGSPPAGAVADPAGAVADPAGAFFAGRPVGLAVLARVRAVVDATGPHTVRTTRSQVAFRRARSFAWLWAPGRYLARPGAEVVLTIALGRHDPSPRFKEVTHPSPRHWIHHLEARDAAEIDDEVAAWLSEAWERAG